MHNAKILPTWILHVSIAITFDAAMSYIAPKRASAVYAFMQFIH